MNSSTSVPSTSSTRDPSSFLLLLSLVAMLLMWAFNYVAARFALRYMDGVTLGALRFELAALIILPFYFLRRNRTPLRLRDIWPFTYLGLLLAINQCCFTIGLSHTSSDHSAMILATGPISILLLARILKLEQLTPGKIFGMAIAFIGVVILATEQGLDIRHSATFTGDSITLAGSSAFALYTVLGKKVAREYDSLSMNTFNYLAGAIVLLPLAVRQGFHLHWGEVSWAAWAGMVYMAAISSVAAYCIFYWALRYMDASRVSAMSYFLPVATILIAAIFLGEHPTRYLIAGGAAILLGVYLTERGLG